MKILRKKPSTQDKSDVSDDLDGCLAVGSVIVYVWRQMDADIIAENIQVRGITGGVAVYHGGMDSGARAKAQSKVSNNERRFHRSWSHTSG
jgi:superfamily II DNA helicase RecQ